jgi:hypothetical protein
LKGPWNPRKCEEGVAESCDDVAEIVEFLNSIILDVVDEDWRVETESVVSNENDIPSFIVFVNPVEKFI